MIPSDHFVRFYNEVFKALQARDHADLLAYWHELGRLQSLELADRFRQGGLLACQEYWDAIFREENCVADTTLTDDYLELRMHRCPSLSKVLDNDATPCDLYCDHCMAWVEPVMQEAGLHAVCDMESRTAPHCVTRIYTDKAKADAFEKQCTLVAAPYAKGSRHGT